MRKIQLLGLMLVAVCAFGAFGVASAFAALEFTLAEWLVGSAAITAALKSDTLGELLFENLKEKASIICSGLFEGTVGPNGEDEITQVFSLSGTLIEALDPTLPAVAEHGLECKGEATCENGSEVWPVNLPFLTLLVLDTTEEKWFDLVLNAEYLILCLAAFGLVNVEELCVAAANTFGEVKNVTGGVEPVGAATPEGTCNGTAEVGLIEAVPGGLITVPGEGTLTVSN